MKEMINELNNAYGGNWRYLVLLGAGLLFGLIFLKEWRKALVFPLVIVSAFILNPVFYGLWNRYIGRAYWRALWAIPIIIGVAIVPAFITERTNRKITKVIVIVSSVVIASFGSTLIYQNAFTTFSKAKNPEKLPESAVKVANELLELDEEPFVISDYSLSVYLRQYSGKIHSLYGRDHPSIAPNAGLAVRTTDILESSDGNYVVLAQSMLNNDYKYLVTHNEEEDRRQKLIDAGFSQIKQVDKYGIYEPHGKRTERRMYNKYHQVTEIASIDEDGKIQNNGEGYAIVRYVYTAHNDLSYRYFYNESNKKLNMGSGYLHDLINSLRDQNITIFISAKDDASTGMQSSVVNDMHSLGIKADLMGKYRYSFFAVVSSRTVIEELSEKEVCYSGIIGEAEYTIVSAGALAGNNSSILIDGVEYSKNLRGLNIVVFSNDKESVIDSFNVDTFKENMPVYR